jgi:predicted amidohydrolase
MTFRTWNSFRETRAVENSVYFVAVNYAGDYYGETAIVEPWVDENHEPDTLGVEEGVLVKTLYRDVLDKVRADFPYYRQLKKEVP